MTEFSFLWIYKNSVISFQRSPRVSRVMGCFRAMWWTVTHTLASPLSSSALGSLHWLMAEKKPSASGRGAASAGGTDTGLSSPPSQNQRKVMTSGWKWEAWVTIVTTPGERVRYWQPFMMSLNSLKYLNVCSVCDTSFLIWLWELDLWNFRWC